MIIINSHILRFAHDFFYVHFLMCLEKLIYFLVFKSVFPDAVDLFQVEYNSVTKVLRVYLLWFIREGPFGHIKSKIHLVRNDLSRHGHKLAVQIIHM